VLSAATSDVCNDAICLVVRAAICAGDIKVTREVMQYLPDFSTQTLLLVGRAASLCCTHDPTSRVNLKHRRDR
jgi:hypothetical protein